MSDGWPCEDCSTLRHELEAVRGEIARLRKSRNELYDASALGRVADDLDEDNSASEAKTVRVAIETIEKMRRALLVVEWLETDGRRDACAVCSGPYWADGIPSHAPRCLLDAALTAVGLDTQEKRNEAREELEKTR